MSLICDHSKTKIKLVSWAIYYKGKHEQGFKHKKCCAKCGQVFHREEDGHKPLPTT